MFGTKRACLRGGDRIPGLQGCDTTTRGPLLSTVLPVILRCRACPSVALAERRAEIVPSRGGVSCVCGSASLAVCLDGERADETQCAVTSTVAFRLETDRGYDRQRESIVETGGKGVLTPARAPPRRS